MLTRVGVSSLTESWKLMENFLACLSLNVIVA